MVRVVLLIAACAACAELPERMRDPNTADTPTVIADDAMVMGSNFELVPDHLRVTRRSGAAVEYLVQDDSGQTIVWIAGGIAAGDAVIVETL